MKNFILFLSLVASLCAWSENLKDDDIHVEDDYGVLTPNVAMAPISFSNAVDFARGDTLAVSGQPTGVKYDDKSAPRMLSGIPTKPGDYTLTFKAKIVTAAVTNERTQRVTYTYRSATATSSIRVKAFPTIAATLSEEAAAAGNKVSGTGSFKAGTKVTLKATAAKDWSFAGWSGVEGLDALKPSLSYVMGTNDLTEIGATFVHKRDDVLWVDDPGVVVVAKGAAFSTNLLELIETRSLPTASVSGLPNGLKFDAKTFVLSGMVGKTAKAGYVYATVSAKNASGYTFVRVVKFAVLETVSDDIPAEPMGKNEADIDFSDLEGLVTGGFYPSEGVGTIGFLVDPATNGADVTAIAVSGLPSGLKAAAIIEDGFGEVVVFGTPNKPGRSTVKVQVTYSDRKKATSEHAFTVEDGGSGWLDVESFDAAMGTVSGAGVYASGATVKLGAKPTAGNVFAGWFEDEGLPFDVLAATDGVDYRTAAASFIFRKELFSNVRPVVYGGFVAKADDAVAIGGLEDVWEIVPSENGERSFTVESASLPKLTVTGLPKGVKLDAAGERLVYSKDSQSAVVPGYYTVTIKAVNQSKSSVTAKLTVFVENKTTDAIGGLDPAPEAYPLYAGVSLDPELIMPEIDVADGWKLSVSGLPAGLSLKSAKDETGATYYYVAGVATKATTNTVTFTAAKGKEKEVATVTIGVSALPAWACGTYDGAYSVFDETETNAVGQITMTVSAAGKVSGKILKGGKSYSFTATSYAGYDPESDCFWTEVVVPWANANKETFLLSVGHDGAGLGSAFLEPVGDGAYFAEAVQNAWLRKDMNVPTFATGAKQPVLKIDEMVCKFGTSGTVTISGKISGLTISGKSQTLFVSDDGNGVYARFVNYVSNSKLPEGFYCEMVDVFLSDQDGDGKFDMVEKH